MAKKPKRKTPAKSKTQQQMVSKSFRLPGFLWEKLDWEAAARGMPKAELVRTTLLACCRDAQPPVSGELRPIKAAETAWKRWELAAAGLGISVSQLLCDVMERACDALKVADPSDEPETKTGPEAEAAGPAGDGDELPDFG